jgi:chromosome segregation ATPase
MSSDGITFLDGKSAYLPNADIKLAFKIGKDYNRSRRDWVGIFRVGFSSSRDYYTFQWVPDVPVLEGQDEVEVKVTYPSRSIPTEDGHFYQFAYVSASTGNVAAYSETFVMGQPLEKDPEFIEIPSSEGMESMLMIATSSDKNETSPEIAGLRDNISALEDKLKAVKTERDEMTGVVESLKAQLTSSEDANLKLQETLEEAERGQESLARRNEELEAQVQAQQDESLDKDVQIEALRREYEDLSSQMKQRIVESEEGLVKAKLENEGLLRQLSLAKDMETAVGDCQSELTAMRVQLDQQRTEAEEVQFKLIEENKELKAAFQKMQSDLDGLLGEKMNLEEEMDRLKHQLQESEDTVNALMGDHVKVEELNSELGEKKKEIGSLQARNIEQRETITKFGEDLSEKETAMVRMKEELALAQTNIAELMGASPDERPTVRREGVDPAAHEALNEILDKVQQDKRALSEECDTLRVQVDSLRQREKELVTKLEMGKEEYTKKATEVVELSKQVKKLKSAEEEGQTLVVSVKESQTKVDNHKLTEQLEAASSEIAQLKAELGELQQSQDMAITELTGRKEEIDKLKKDLLTKDNEIMLIEERTDTKIHDKNGELQQLRETNEGLKREVDDMRRSADAERDNIVNLTEALRLREESLEATKVELEHVRDETENGRKTIVDLKEALRLNEESIRARTQYGQPQGLPQTFYPTPQGHQQTPYPVPQGQQQPHYHAPREQLPTAPPFRVSPLTARTLLHL